MGRYLRTARRRSLGKQLSDVVGLLEREWPSVESPESSNEAFTLLWPVDAALNEENPFGANPELYAPLGYPGHPGIDFLADHQPVVACEAGTVTLAGPYGNAGNIVRLRHEGFETRYCHLSEVHVEAGQWVDRGQQIGISGETGFAQGPHLHLDLWLDGERNQYQGRVDAAPYLEERTQ